MNLMKAITLLTLGFFLSLSEANAELSFERIETKFKALVTRLIGEEWVEKIWGPQDAVELPNIPAITEKSTDTKTYDKKAIEQRKIKGISPELKEKLDQAFIEEMIEVVLKRGPNETEVGSWLNTLNQGGSREGVYRGVILGEEYLGREEMPGTLSDSTKQFVGEYMDTYLNRKVSPNFVNETNLYVVKRLVIEKTLDVMDAFDSEEDLMKWYAVLSSDLANRFPGLYKSSLRSNTKAKSHFEWAQQVSYEHIQSEVILKLHMAFNFVEG